MRMNMIKSTIPFLGMIFFVAASAQATEPASDQQWAQRYPNEYYSLQGSADHMDDPHDKAGGYGHGSMAKYLMANLRTLQNSKQKNLINETCFSCKSSSFNDLYKRNGNKVFSNQSDIDYEKVLKAEDYWSCGTCHSDINNPKGTVGAKIFLAPTIGKSLFAKLSPNSAVCAQCHNDLSIWAGARIVDTAKYIAENKDIYRYGWDPDSMIKATIEDALPSGVAIPGGKVYSTSKAAHAKTDKNLGIYLFADGSHADAEVYVDGPHYKMNVGCADCHMPVVEDRLGNKYRSHDASKSVLNSKAAMQYCMTCHKNETVKTPKDMIDFVKAAQQKVALKDKAVADKLDETFELLKKAIEENKLPAESLEKAKFNYARASYFKKFVYGNRGATPGEKVAHNPQKHHDYLDQAIVILDEVQQSLKQPS